MENKEKMKTSYNKIIANLEKRLSKLKKDKKLYHKLKIILAVLSMIVLSFGLWPIAIIGLVSMILCFRNEDKKSLAYNKLVNKLEDAYFSLQEIEASQKEAVEKKENEIPEQVSETKTKDEHLLLDVLYGENDDYKIYRK